MLKKIAHHWTNKIAEHTPLEEEQQQVVEYGILAFLHNIAFLTAIIVFGLLCGTLPCILTICLTAAIIRRYSGGAHAETSGLCTGIGAIVCLLLSLLCQYGFPCIAPYPIIIALICAVGFGTSLLSILTVVPVDCPTKRIKTPEKRKRMKRTSLFLWCVYVGIALFLVAFSFHKYLVCMSCGLLWQTFMLTKAGEWFLIGIQKPFSYFLSK